MTTPDGENEPFNISTGVLQGNTLAPYLFVIVLDYTLREAIKNRKEELGFQLVKRQSRQIRPEVLTDLDFADDFVLLSEEVQQAQELLCRVETSVAKVWLKMNSGKTKNICPLISTREYPLKQMMELPSRKSAIFILGPGWLVQRKTSRCVEGPL